jgi:membrane protease YdiL (CAAX protease family)
MANSSGYRKATSHPLPCLLFVLPLLAGYEGGVLWLGGPKPDALRNGADAWVRWALEEFGLRGMAWVPPALIAGFFLGWSMLRRQERPTDLLGLVCGMTLESVVFAVGLYALGKHFLPLLDRQAVVPAADAVRQAVTFVGAGVYEEVLFRLLLLTAIRAVVGMVGLPGIPGSILALLASSVLFSLAHHAGPFGQAFELKVFVFRMLAGTYFGIIYLLRGFGVTAGTHACYDVMVGVALG